MSYDEHTSDKVLFVQLRKNASNEEAVAAMYLIKPYMEQNKIDGMAFVETPEKFRIASPVTPEPT